MRPAAVAPSHLAGTWYPAEPEAWHRQVPELFAEDPGGVVPRALVVPHAGLRFSGPTAAAAYRRLRPDGLRRVVLFGPSHFHAFRGASARAVRGYATPLGFLPAAEDLRRALVAERLLCEEPRAHVPEHSVEIQLPFLRARLGATPVLPIVLGSLGPRGLRRLARALVERCDEETLFLASSDFTHYGERFGYLPRGPAAPRDVVRALDRTSYRLLEERRLRQFRHHRARTGTTICGALALDLLLEIATLRDLDLELAAETTSGDLLGDWTHSVSYAAFVGRSGEVLEEAESRTLWDAAAAVVRACLLESERPVAPEPATPTLESSRGAFVTLRRDGRVRACMGQIQGCPHLLGAVLRAAELAAGDDPRFPPMLATELPALELEVTVLSRPVRVEHPEEIRLGEHGILVEAPEGRALLLPQVAPDHGLDVAEFWAAVCRKAGVDPSRLRDPDVERFRFRGHGIGPRRLAPAA